MKKAIKIIAIILVILLLFGVFMLIRKLSNNFTTDVKTFYLVVDGQMVSSNSTTGLNIFDKDIEVHTVGESINGKQDFKYQIVRNTSAGSFTFYLDGEKHTLADEKDFTKGFEITKEDGVLHIKSCTLTAVLNRVFGEGEIELPELKNETCYFTLIVNSQDGKHSISIDFAIPVYLVGIELDHTHLEF